MGRSDSAGISIWHRGQVHSYMWIQPIPSPINFQIADLLKDTGVFYIQKNSAELTIPGFNHYLVPDCWMSLVGKSGFRLRQH